jgi:hypothetical protein
MVRPEPREKHAPKTDEKPRAAPLGLAAEVRWLSSPEIGRPACPLLTKDRPRSRVLGIGGAHMETIGCGDLTHAAVDQGSIEEQHLVR